MSFECNQTIQCTNKIDSNILHKIPISGLMAKIPFGLVDFDLNGKGPEPKILQFELWLEPARLELITTNYPILHWVVIAKFIIAEKTQLPT